MKRQVLAGDHTVCLCTGVHAPHPRADVCHGQ